MRRRIDASKARAIVLALVTGWTLAGFQSMAEAASTVTLTQTVHFAASDGSDVVVEAGTYQVDVSASHLSLTAEGGAPRLLEAHPTAHSETIQTPLAVMVPAEDPDVLHVVLLLPNGQALDAPGSLSGTRPRASGFPVATLSQIQIAAMQVPQAPVRRDHRGEPQQMPAPTSPPSPFFGTPTPGRIGPSTLAKFRMLELGTFPPKFATGDAVTSFYLAYDCQVEGLPCTARQDVINVTWTIVARGSAQAGGVTDGIPAIKIPARVLHGANDSSCEPFIKKKFPQARCFYGMTHTESGDYKVFVDPGMIFRSILTVGSETVWKDFMVERTQPSPSLKIGGQTVRDHR